jgi:acyl dehydratase
MLLFMLSRPAAHELLGATFPGGRTRLAYWENYLLTDCTTAAQLPDSLGHPVALFHLPILGAGITIGTLFDWCGAEGAGTVGLDGYDWEYLEPLRVDVDFDVCGSIIRWERLEDETGAPYDAMSFRIELCDIDDGHVVARVTNSWRFRRPSLGAPAAPVRLPKVIDDGVVTGTPIAPFVVESVDAQKMKTMAALLRDPYQVHWDREATTAIGLGGRVINQGPLNLSYVVNALHAYAGAGCVRRLTVAFNRPVFDGDRVVAGGEVLETVDGVSTCRVWLRRDDPVASELMVTGTAIITAAP